MLHVNILARFFHVIAHFVLLFQEMLTRVFFLGAIYTKFRLLKGGYSRVFDVNVFRLHFSVFFRRIQELRMVVFEAAGETI